LETDEELSREDKRDVTMERINTIIDESQKIQSRDEMYSNTYRLFVSGMPLSAYSHAVSVKIAVAVILYYKAIEILGTEKHQKYKNRLFDKEDIGCFALTELGHGSNVKGILTTAHFDKDTDEFVINTPEDLAMKFWIGGAAKSANMSTVFA
jgi:acyl-CoA oxidase